MSMRETVLIYIRRALLSENHHPALTTLQQNVPLPQNATPRPDASYTPEYPGDGLFPHTQQETLGTLISNPPQGGQ